MVTVLMVLSHRNVFKWRVGLFLVIKHQMVRNSPINENMKVSFLAAINETIEEWKLNGILRLNRVRSYLDLRNKRVKKKSIV